MAFAHAASGTLVFGAPVTDGDAWLPMLFPMVVARTDGQSRLRAVGGHVILRVGPWVTPRLRELDGRRP